MTVSAQSDLVMRIARGLRPIKGRQPWGYYSIDLNPRRGTYYIQVVVSDSPRPYPGLDRETLRAIRGIESGLRSMGMDILARTPSSVTALHKGGGHILAEWPVAYRRGGAGSPADIEATGIPTEEVRNVSRTEEATI